MTEVSLSQLLQSQRRPKQLFRPDPSVQAERAAAAAAAAAKAELLAETEGLEATASLDLTHKWTKRELRRFARNLVKDSTRARVRVESVVWRAFIRRCTTASRSAGDHAVFGRDLDEILPLEWVEHRDSLRAAGVSIRPNSMAAYPRIPLRENK